MSSKSFGESSFNGHVDAYQENKFLRQKKCKSSRLEEESKKQLRDLRGKSGEDELRNPQSLSPDSRIKQQIS